jgi:hypothetical protein
MARNFIEATLLWVLLDTPVSGFTVRLYRRLFDYRF